MLVGFFVFSASATPGTLWCNFGADVPLFPPCAHDVPIESAELLAKTWEKSLCVGPEP